jgi:hypothetical protein
MTINVGDRPDKLTDEVRAKILHHVRADLSVNNAARHARICEETLQRWMALGKADVLNDQETYLAKLYVDVRENQANKVSEIIQLIGSGSKNWQGSAWILEKCFAEEFGAEAPAYKDLLALCHSLMAQFNELKKPTHGVLKNG